MTIEIQSHKSSWSDTWYWVVWEDGKVIASGQGCASKSAGEKAAMDAYIASRRWD